MVVSFFVTQIKISNSVLYWNMCKWNKQLVELLKKIVQFKLICGREPDLFAISLGEKVKMCLLEIVLVCNVCTSLTYIHEMYKLKIGFNWVETSQGVVMTWGGWDESVLRSSHTGDMCCSVSVVDTPEEELYFVCVAKKHPAFTALAVANIVKI